MKKEYVIIGVVVVAIAVYMMYRNRRINQIEQIKAYFRGEIDKPNITRWW